MPLIDSHCHFDFSAFDADRAQVWQRCCDKGIRQLIIPGVEPAQWQRAKSLSAEYEGLYYAAGLHPWWLEQYFSIFNHLAAACSGLHGSLRELLSEASCVAVGECGLDKLIATPLAVQEKILHTHIALAREYNKPLMLHCRHYHAELIHLLKQEHTRHPLRGVVHGFTGSEELAREYWKLGIYLGVGGSITYPRANKTRSAIQQLPLQALLIETDAPDMPLQGRQGQRNSPEYLSEVAEALAELRGDTVENIIRQTSANACALYGLSGF